jgi:MoaA/NifB/PqqE/SkfB family radical SAM enzyme
MKKEGYNILNSEASIRQWLPHFNEEIPERNSPCAVALRNLNIISNGDVSMCGFRESKIGNIKNDDFREMWHSERTQKLRKALVNCKKLCTATCVIKRSWKDYIDLFVKLMEG